MKRAWSSRVNTLSSRAQQRENSTPTQRKMRIGRRKRRRKSRKLRRLRRIKAGLRKEPRSFS